ncbi:uncharacterized protein Tco025E_00731 [Trypanosoma conorhini]|uniref:SP-RING-type domain-containing protein n=1 Tax=Trypanosoma conorhini TaxID=83891 RepID=A0A3R7LGZ0_9TRYP|nr:uncharacterized protein Tco025E_00731 [Trypanosoma conorhini]RNF27073.1 hypothetical protein Tco025E_00731 [Trypanosoma conorhini]
MAIVPPTPPPSRNSPLYPVHAVLRRFDLHAGSSNGVALQRIGPPPPPPLPSAAPLQGGRMELVLFPCQLGEPTQPIGWPPASLYECTVMVNDAYVTEDFPRSPTRSASHRTLAGLPLSRYLRLREDGSIDPEAPLRLFVTSKAKWAATFLLAWCRVNDASAVVADVVARLLRSEAACTGSTASSASSSSLNDDGSENGAESDVDVDSGWVEDDGDDVDKADKPGGGHTASAVQLSNRATSSAGTALGAAAPVDAEDDDGGLVGDGEAVVTLRCPLSYQRIRLAGKGKHCSHLACFDVATYLESSLRSSAWNCPICDGAVFVHDLRLDRTLQSALDGLGAEVDTVVLFGAGHREWRAACQQKESSLGATDKRSSRRGGSVTRAAHGDSGKGQQAQPQLCVVDDSEEEDAGGDDADVLDMLAVAGGRKRARYEQT